MFKSLIFLIVLNSTIQILNQQQNAVYKLINNQIMLIKRPGYFNLTQPLSLQGIIINLPEQKILNDSVILTGLQIESIEYIFTIVFKNLNGFNVNSNPINQITFTNIRQTKIIYRISTSKFHFYYNNNNSLLDQSCDSKIINTNFKYFLFNSLGVLIDKNSLYSTETCPLIFQNSFIKCIHFKGLSESLILINKLQFKNITKQNKDLNAIVFQLNLDVYHYTIDKKILDLNVFKNSKVFDITGPINSIENDLFKEFKRLKMLRIKTQHLRNLIVRDNKWFDSLNSNVKIDLTQRPKSSDTINLAFILVLFQIYSSAWYYKYPDEDFCYFSKFPHERLVLPILAPNKASSCSCTQLSLIINSHRVDKYLEFYNSYHLSNYYYEQYYSYHIDYK